MATQLWGNPGAPIKIAAPTKRPVTTIPIKATPATAAIDRLAPSDPNPSLPTTPPPALYGYNPVGAPENPWATWKPPAAPEPVKPAGAPSWWDPGMEAPPVAAPVAVNPAISAALRPSQTPGIMPAGPRPREWFEGPKAKASAGYREAAKSTSSLMSRPKSVMRSAQGRNF